VKYLAAMIVASALLSCASPSATPEASTPSARDGSSISNAIVVPKTGKTTGVAYEYAYIGSHYPGAQPVSQAFLVDHDKVYDEITFVTPDSKQHTLYFDIQRFVGQF
jgi:hypothetical protein